MKKSLFFVLITLAVVGVFLYMRPAPAVRPVNQVVTVPQVQPISLPWPSRGQAAIGAVGYGVLDSHNTGQSVPVASITKIITALAVLRQKPLEPGSQGPVITLDSTDVGSFNHYYLNNGSVAKVEAGEHITEYQALQGMLIPSSNNLADSLARWAFGSIDAYVKYANLMVKDIGLNHTKVGGANGFDDQTTSTADDLVKLGIEAMKDPVISKIVAQATANIPVAGTIKNVNWLLGTDGVTGIKTGNTDKAGGCYLVAANRNIGGLKVTVIGAVLGQAELNDAISVARKLVQAGDAGFHKQTIIQKGEILANYHTPWGSDTKAVAAKNLSFLAWKGRPINAHNSAKALVAPAKKGNRVGKIMIQNGQKTSDADIILQSDLPAPPLLWRLFRH